MADKTPKELLAALAMVRDAKAPQLESMGAVASVHAQRVRNVFLDPNIVGIGIAQKMTDKKATGELGLCFYVEKKQPKSKVHQNRMVPPVISVADRTAVFTDVQEIGRIVPQVNKRDAPLQSGYSCGHVKTRAGTLGALVKKGKKYYILSNAHVLALSGKGKRGDEVCYPGMADRGNAATQVVATLDEFARFDVTDDFVNTVDAALAEIDKDWAAKLDLSIYKAKSPIKMADPLRDMRIVKRGRTSGETEGVVRDVHFSIAIRYPGIGKLGFIDQVLCTQYSAGGDSGSIVVDKATGALVGLHFAGSPKGSVFNPIREVVKQLKFKFIDA